MLECPAFYLSLLLVVSSGFWFIHFPPDMGHDTQEKSFLEQRDRGSWIQRTSLLISDVSEKALDQKGDTWTLIKGTPTKIGVRSPAGDAVTPYHSSSSILNRKRVTLLLLKGGITTLPPWQEEDSPLAPQRSPVNGNGAAQPTRTRHHPQLSLGSSELPFFLC